MDRPVADQRLHAPDLVDHGVDEGLAAEAGIDRHHQDHVQPVEHIFDRALRRRRVDRHAGLLAEIADRLQRAVEMRSGLRMYGHAVGAGLGKGREVGIGRRDHQVAVEERLGAIADRLDDGRAEGDVGHEMPVHHVEMDPVRAGGRDGLDLIAQPGEVRSQDGGRNQGLGDHGCSRSCNFPSPSRRGPACR